MKFLIHVRPVEKMMDIGQLPIIIMGCRVQRYEEYRGMVGYAFPLLCRLVKKGSIPATSEAQDSILATVQVRPLPFRSADRQRARLQSHSLLVRAA